jgi:hypothetical protein
MKVEDLVYGTYTDECTIASSVKHCDTSGSLKLCRYNTTPNELSFEADYIDEKNNEVISEWQGPDINMHAEQLVNFLEVEVLSLKPLEPAPSQHAAEYFRFIKENASDVFKKLKDRLTSMQSSEEASTEGANSTAAQSEDPSAE